MAGGCYVQFVRGSDGPLGLRMPALMLALTGCSPDPPPNRGYFWMELDLGPPSTSVTSRGFFLPQNVCRQSWSSYRSEASRGGWTTPQVEGTSTGWRSASSTWATEAISVGGSARVQFFHNETDTGSQRWLEVRVLRSPETGDAGGVSARIAVKTGDVIQFRDVKGASSRASQSALSARFGLGQWTGSEWVAVLWPDGRQVIRINVEGDQRLEL